jgi:monothiol glutaredoxin
MKTEDTIRKQLADNPVILYMKGVPDAPQCGFSAKAVSVLQATGIPFAFVDVLQAPFIREKLPSVSQWPTFPQLFVNGELIGGSDIVEDLAKQGQLQPMLEKAVGKPAQA